MRQPTRAQQAALKRLERTAGARRRGTSEDRGSSIVRQFRLYLESEDATKIGQALYRYLTLKIPFIIAHYGLVPPDGGFRTYYQEPARMLADILPHAQQLEARIERGDPDTVYSDGADDLAVTKQVLALANEHLEPALRNALARGRARDLADAEALAARHGFELTPAPAEHAEQPRGDLIMTAAQSRVLLGLRDRLAARGGEIIEIREEAGFIGATLRDSGIRRDGSNVELLVLPNGHLDVGQLAVPTGSPVAWATVEQAARLDQAPPATQA